LVHKLAILLTPQLQIWPKKLVKQSLRKWVSDILLILKKVKMPCNNLLKQHLLNQKALIMFPQKEEQLKNHPRKLEIMHLI